MSTEDINKAVVTLKKGVDVDAFIEDMVSGSNHNQWMPNRRVELYNEKIDSKRNVDFVLTQNESEQLKSDPRIVDVRWGTKLENGIAPRKLAVDSSRTYSRTSTQNNTHYNWAIPAVSNSVNPFVTTSLSFAQQYTLTGSNVDVVIQDSGIDVNHPEWLNPAGSSSRLQQIDWPTAANLSGTYTQNANHYTDSDGHGTHVAGTVAGRLYGWAKDSNIYAITIIDNAAAYGISASFNLIRGWHNAKTNGRPTIVNMSWGYFSYYENIISGNYRGTPWTGTGVNSAYGMLASAYNYNSVDDLYYHPIRVSSVDADIEDCIDDGVILVAAAGNDAHKMDVSGGTDYNNYYVSSLFGNRYYHRGATPNGPTGVVSVGSIGLSLTEQKNEFSTCGPGVNVYAPGESVQSAMPVGAALSAGAVNYPLNSSFRAKKISGTSMASPQVCGVLACLLEARPWYTASDAVQWLAENATQSRLTDSGGSYTDFTSLQSGPNRYLYQPFNTSTVFSLTNGLGIG
jgi:subtilisin family serine protease